MTNARLIRPLAVAMVAVFGCTSLVVAQPTTAPSVVPPITNVTDADSRPTPALEAAAMIEFDAANYAGALPLLKNLSIRLRGEPDRVGPVLEKVRVCEMQIASQPDQPKIEGINAPRTAHVKPIDGTPFELTLKKLGNFDYDPEKGGGIPSDVNELNGATIKLTGFMIPIDESDKISKFVLVPDLFGCCFGQPPQIQHTAIVVCPTGKAVSYFPDQINVVGKLKVAEQKDDGYVTSIFELTAESIRPANQ